MANTALLQAVAQMLMQGRPPSPLAPVAAPIPPGGFAMPMLEAPPTSVAPIAPMPARDESLIEQLTGPRPVAPVAQPDSLLQKIARALIGFGAGTQGFGPQYLAQLREERERPQREFQAATEQYEANRRRATVFAEEKQQREQAGIQRRADIQSDRDFQLFELDKRDRMQEARDLRQQAAALEREERKIESERLEQERKKVEENKKRVDSIAKELFDDLKISRQQARAFAEFEVNGTPLSKADEKIYARLEKYRRPVGGGGGGAAGASGEALKLAQEIEIIKDKMIEAEATTDNPELKQQLRVQLNNAIRRSAKFPELQVGLQDNKWPYVFLNGQPVRTRGQQQAAQPQQGPADAEAQAYAQRFGISIEQARKELTGQ